VRIDGSDSGEAHDAAKQVRRLGHIGIVEVDFMDVTVDVDLPG
jgi:hypothetical protein